MEGWLLYVTLTLAAIGAATVIVTTALSVVLWRDKYLLKKQAQGSCFSKLRIIQ